MTLLRLQNEANGLTVQHTKQNLEPQLLSYAETNLSLPRERFSATAKSGTRAQLNARQKAAIPDRR
jgi:hypothetical protein